MTRRPSSHSKSARSATGRRKYLGLVVASVLIIAGVVAVRAYWPTDSATAQVPGQAAGRTAPHTAQPEPQSPRRQAPTRSNREGLQVMAKVNGEDITREDLARDCLRHYGKEVLESIISKTLIALECRARGLQVTSSEIDAEIAKMAKHFNFSVQQWYEVLEKERGIRPKQYRSDIIWPIIGLRKLAADQLKVSDEELQRAYETQYGPSIKARLIACNDPKTAEQLRVYVLAKPDEFGRVAVKHSKDPVSASEKGCIPPVHRYGGPKEIEDALFNMRDGQISPVLKVRDKYVIVKREMMLPGRNVPMAKVRDRLRHFIEERKIQKVSDEIFEQLEDKAQVQNYLNDPAKRNLGIVAVLNGHKITVRQLAEVCIERHGKEVLEGAISRKLIEQACRKANVQVTQQDLRAEIARVASVSAPPKPDGTPDIKEWIKLVTERQKVSYEVYVHDAVWPSVALRKLVKDQVRVTEDDIQRGYEANYGPMVQCLAIVFADLRQTKRVWQMAQKKYQELQGIRQKQIQQRMATKEQADQMFLASFSDYFGNLAEQYSREPGSKSLRGKVSPIRKYGGQPTLEKEAFALKPGELSGIIQVDDMYVVLFCEHYTTPEKIALADVRDIIVEDLTEKKLFQAMGKYYQRLQDYSMIDNYLAGTTQAPQRPIKNTRNLPRSQQIPVMR
jgi:parvulin-like peptidyl-prolyl isomerase